MSRFSCMIAAVLASLFVGGASYSQPQTTAEEHVSRGLMLYAEKNFAGAAHEFAIAHELEPSGATLFAWAQAVRLGGDCTSAMGLFARFLATQPDRADAEAARRAMAMCEEEPGEPPQGALATDVVASNARTPSVAPAAVATRSSIAPRVVTAAPRAERSGIVFFVRTDIDVTLTGAVFAPGVALELIAGWSLFAAPLVGQHVGVEPGSRFRIGQGVLQPYATVAVPVFFAAGARAGIRGALGLLLPLGDRFAATLEAGGSRSLSTPTGLSANVLLGSVGVELSL